jgi:signal transduction histidine kinase
MLRLSQRQSGHDTTPVDLARALDDAVELCGPSELSAAGVVVMRKYEVTPPVRASATQLQEAFIQLIQNGRAAMPSGGKLTLEIRPVEDSLIRVVISDSGTGISPENLPRIFDPFFTTKVGDKGGTGLGLSFVHRIVEDNGGTIQAESSLGAGTKFTLTFSADAGRTHRT